MNEDFNKMKYDDFEDRLNWDKFKKEGIAELERRYKISGRFLPPTLVAKGITAFLSFENGPDDLFGSSLKHGKQLDFDNIFQLYFDQCFKFLIAKELEISSKSERKTRTELIRLHLKNEERLLIESHQLDCGLLNDNRQVFERIKKAAKDYRDWLNETNPEAGIFVPKIKQFPEYLNPDNQDELAKRLKNEFIGKKGKTIAIMILALEQTKNICYQSRTELYESIGLYFDCKLNESGINKYLNEYGEERKLLLASGKIEQIIDKLKLKSS